MEAAQGLRVKQRGKFASFSRKKAPKLTKNNYYLIVFIIPPVLLDWKNRR